MKAGSPNKFLNIAPALLIGLLVASWAGVVLAYDSGPAKRMDFLGSMREPVAEEGPAYDPAPARRMDFLGNMAEPVAEQGPAYDSAPPRRMDFLGTHRVEPAE
jgi:hypothetical protein